jgi:phenylalanyl-tRNA synthetase beta subunit
VDLKILDAKLQAFINDNIGKSITKLALQKNQEMNWHFILNQIEAKTKQRRSCLLGFAQNIIYPNKISIEQTSSENSLLQSLLNFRRINNRFNWRFWSR